MKYLSFLSVCFLQKLETLRFPVTLSNKLGRPPPNRCRSLKVFWRPSKGRNSPYCVRQNLWQALGMTFPALRSLLKVQSETPYKSFSKAKKSLGASLVAQWLGISLPMQGTSVRALVWEDPTCRRATRPVSHNY